MATHTEATPTRPNATFIRRSTDYPEYSLVRFDASDLLAIVLAVPIDPEFGVSVLSDGFVTMPADDPRYPAETVEIFILRDDGVDLDNDLERHADELAEETRVLIAEAAEEFRA